MFYAKSAIFEPYNSERRGQIPNKGQCDDTCHSYRFQPECGKRNPKIFDNRHLLLYTWTYSCYLNKEVGPQKAKLALLLIKFMKYMYGVVQFLIFEYLQESPNCVYISNI